MKYSNMAISNVSGITEFSVKNLSQILILSIKNIEVIMNEQLSNYITQPTKSR